MWPPVTWRSFQVLWRSGYRLRSWNGRARTHAHTGHCNVGTVLCFFFKNGISDLSMGHSLARSPNKSLHVSGRPYFPSAKFRGYMSRGVFYVLTIWPRGRSWLRHCATSCIRSRFRFPMVSSEFFIDIILPAALWSWCRLSFSHK
jgi:hypothetical protein